jgi:hypothetical protein
MAILILTTGKIKSVEPRNGYDFSLEELYKMLSCELIEVVGLSDSVIMIVDESGALKPDRAWNKRATKIYQETRGEVDEDRIKSYEDLGFAVMRLPGENKIYGNALICSKNELK